MKDDNNNELHVSFDIKNENSFDSDSSKKKKYACQEKYKVIIIGDSSVGKTSLFYRYKNKTFTTQILSTIGFEYNEVEVTYKDKVVGLQFWDTCGQETYRSLIRSFYSNAIAAVFVFSVDK